MIPDSATIAAVLGAIPVGRERAIKGKQIAERLGLSRLRTVGEAVAELREQGIPISSTSADGYWRAETRDDLERSLAEVERRARACLRQRRLLKASLAVLNGQRSLDLQGDACG